MPQYAEKRADIFGQEVRHLHRCEVPSAWHFVPAKKVVAALHEFAGGNWYFLGKVSDSTGRMYKLSGLNRKGAFLFSK